MIIDCIADLHGFYPTLEGGDVLIVAGDLTAHDTHLEYLQFFKWIANTPYRKRIVIAGNHDNLAQKEDILNVAKGDFEYLCDSGTEITFYPYLDPPNLENIGIPYKRRTLKIWGSPWTPWFKGVNPRCKAFMKKDKELSKKWEMIPLDTDILITHGPPYCIRDGIPREDGSEHHVGSESLYYWLKYVERPPYHIFGHIHEGYGVEEFFTTYDDKMMQSINCSHVDAKYRPVNKPIRIEIK
jgi:Icc-related predicted phosphoesterase